MTQHNPTQSLLLPSLRLQRTPLVLEPTDHQSPQTGTIRSPQDQPLWRKATLGEFLTSGLRYAYTLGEYQSAVELWIDTGSFDQNKQIFSSLSRNGRRLNAAWVYPCAGSVWSHNAPLESHGLSGRTVGRASRDGNNFRSNSFT